MIRIKRVTEYGGIVFGVMLDDDRPFCLTLEDSRVLIPAGEYELVSRRFNRGGYMTYEVADVPDRTHILIHRGNTVDDTDGCPIVGKRFFKFNSQLGLANSEPAFNEFMGRVESKRIEDRRIIIEDRYSQPPPPEEEPEEKKEGVIVSLIRKALALILVRKAGK